MLELLDEIQQRLGIALLFITHDLRVAAQICDDVAVMRHGRIVEQGPAAEVLTNRSSPIPARFSTPPPAAAGICAISGRSRTERVATASVLLSVIARSKRDEAIP